LLKAKTASLGREIFLSGKIMVTTLIKQASFSGGCFMLINPLLDKFRILDWKNIERGIEL